MRIIHGLFDRVGTVVAVAAMTVAGLACGGTDDAAEAEGTYVHAEEGTIVLEADGEGTITQSADPVPFEWERDGDTITIVFGEDVVSEATLDGDELTFRPGDFSGDEAVVFRRP